MIITAHSGCDGTPDNTLAFVRHVLHILPDAFEVDVHRREDGVLIIAHDTDKTGLYAGCPTLSEVHALIKAQPTLGINYDLKDAGLERAVIGQHEAEAPQNPMYLSGVVSVPLFAGEPALQKRATVLLNAELESDGDAFYLDLAAHPEKLQQAAENVAAACALCGAKVVNVHFLACTAEFQRILAAHGVGVSVWTPDDVAVAKAFAARGVFNITTRNAQGVLSALR